ncbi:pectate lyase [Alistipes sp.]|uniref:pectate lyase n=1 Tax=Alistipes sp. TaxID=1872444 RepID=UPI003AEF775F
MKRILILLALCTGLPAAAAPKNDAASALAAMKRATAYMYDHVSVDGGFVWNYTTDLSRRWGELEAYPTMVWVEKGTPDVGELMLDAYHATGDEYYYDMAVRTARILIRGQLPCGGWNYKFDLAGTASEQRWFATIGRNAWGMGEHGHYYGNATFDDSVTASAVDFLMRIYLEKYDPQFKPALDRALDMILASQYPVGGWPQRWPLMYDHPDADGTPDYSSCITFNDDVTPNNIGILLRMALLLGDARAVEPLTRAMNCVRSLQQGTPAAGWADQYYLDLTPAKARDFEPAAISTVRTRDCIRLLMEFYRWTGDRKFLDGIPAAIAFLRAAALDPALAAELGRQPGKGRILCPRFFEPGTLTPLYLHRKGLHVDNGVYYCDQNPHNVIGHYASLVVIGVEELQRQYDTLLALPAAEATKDSPLLGHARLEMPRYRTPAIAKADPSRARAVIAALDDQGRWIGPLDWVLVPYIGPGSASDPVPDRYEETVGDPHNTASLAAETVEGISLRTYINNMAALIASLPERSAR